MLLPRAAGAETPAPQTAPKSFADVVRQRAMIRAYGVLGPRGIVRRSIFIVDPGGIVRYRQVALLGLRYQDVEDLKRSLRRARAEAAA